MSDRGSAPGSLADAGRLLLRVTLAGLLLFHGVDKMIHGVAWMAGPLARFHLPPWIAYGAYVGEVVAPLLVLVGVLTRLASLVIVVNMVMALVLAAGRFFFTINRTGGWAIELEAFYLLTAVTVVLLGPGRWALAPGRR